MPVALLERSAHALAVVREDDEVIRTGGTSRGPLQAAKAASIVRSTLNASGRSIPE